MIRFEKKTAPHELVSRMSRQKGALLAKLSAALLALASVTACQPFERSTGAIPSSAQSGESNDSATSAGPVLPAIGSTPNGTTAETASVPPVWDFISDDFEAGSLARWGEISPAALHLIPGAGNDGSTGLSVDVSRREAYLYKRDITKTKEGYATFWFNPNNVEIPDQPDVAIPGKSLLIVDVKGYQHYDVVVGLRIWRPSATGQAYKAYLEWYADDGEHFDTASGQFDLANAWQKITVGFRTNEWVAVWVNDVLARKVTGIQNSEPFGQNVEFGKANDDNIITPSGSMRYDNIAFEIPRIADLWVDAVHGSDSNSGMQRNAAFLTIQRAADTAGPGTTVHVLPGIYRESIRPAANGTATDRVTYKAEEGPGTVIVRGSEASSTLSWHPLQSNTIGLPARVDPSKIYEADLSSWKLSQAPRFLVELDDQGKVVARLPLARAPNWPVNTPWKYQEFWWSADGGSAKADCDPATDPDPNCDSKSRSLTQLTDVTNDTDPPGIEPGNLSTLGDLTGATLVAMDTVQGHYVYRRSIIADDVPAGRITVDQPCEYDPGTGNPGLGWGTKYYVEGKPSLLDTPGEWWYDESTGHLYLWPPVAGNPGSMNIEISRQDIGVALANRSNIALEGLTLEFFNDSGVSGQNDAGMRSFNNSVRNVTILYANHGIELEQVVNEVPDDITSGFALEGSEIGYMDTDALHLAYYWGGGIAPAAFTHSGIVNTLIKDNDLHDLSFRSSRDSAAGVLIEHPDEVRFEGNHVHQVAHNGVLFGWSLIQSDKQYGFLPDEIKIGGILVKDNVFEQACQLATDCGELKFWGDPPQTQVFRDVLVTGNVFRDTVGWAYVSEKRRGWAGGPGSNVRGMGGFGLYTDMASGIHVYRNIAYNNAFAGFYVGGLSQDGDMVLYNNIAANSLYGFFFTGPQNHSAVDTQLANNMMVNNEAFGLWYTDSQGSTSDVLVDHNLYYNNGWRTNQNGGLSDPGALIIRRGAGDYAHYPTVADVQANTPWEAHGVEGNPGFLLYNPDDHGLLESFTPNFQLTQNSNNAVERGSVSLAGSLVQLLQKFGVPDQRLGTAYDIGPYETAELRSTPTPQSVQPGGAAQLLLSLAPVALFDELTMTSPHPLSGLSVDASMALPDLGTTTSIVTDEDAAGARIAPAASHGSIPAATALEPYMTRRSTCWLAEANSACCWQRGQEQISTTTERKA